MLSRLHKRGEAFRLVERRDGASVYVDPSHGGDRPIVPVRARPATVDVEAVEAARQDGYAAGLAAAEVERANAHRDGYAEGMAAGAVERDALRDESERVRESAFAEGRAAGVAEAESRADKEMALVQRAAYKKGQAEASEESWTTGYDEGIKRGRAEQIADMEREGGGDAFSKGRAVGRAEGEDMVRRRMAAISIEMLRVIKESTPIRSHFNGCYKIHPECAVKALGRSVGIGDRLVNVSREDDGRRPVRARPAAS